MSVTRYVNGDPSIGQDPPDSQKCALTQQPWGHTPACPRRTIQFGVDQLAKIGGGILAVPRWARRSARQRDLLGGCD